MRAFLLLRSQFSSSLLLIVPCRQCPYVPDRHKISHSDGFFTAEMFLLYFLKQLNLLCIINVNIFW